jgi:SPP1 gp7 family putative phage head morphogenesis protein
LRPVRPSRRAELAYKADLVAIVNHLRAAGAAVVHELRYQWPRVADSPVPSLQAILKRMQVERFGNTGTVAKRMADRAAKRTLTEVDAGLARSVKASIGVDISPILSDGGPIATAMFNATAANIGLITSIPEQYFDRLQSEITDSWAQGERWEAMVGRVQEIGDVTESRAKLIARDQTSKLNASFNEVRQKELGIEKYRWDTAGDERVRESHQELNGQEFRWDDPPDVDGENVHPGEAINCRCVAVPMANLDDVVEHVDQLEAEAA